MFANGRAWRGSGLPEWRLFFVVVSCSVGKKMIMRKLKKKRKSVCYDAEVTEVGVGVGGKHKMLLCRKCVCKCEVKLSVCTN